MELAQKKGLDAVLPFSPLKTVMIAFLLY